MSFRDSEEFKKGRAGERVVARFLQNRGWYVLPSYDYAGEDGNKAPKLTGLSAGYVVPDLFAFKDAQAKWVEVKTKNDATFHRISQTWEHGIPWRHYQHYQKVQGITGAPVYIVVCEEKSGQKLQGSLSALGEPRYSASATMGEMAFWPRANFTPLSSLPDEPLITAAA